MCRKCWEGVIVKLRSGPSQKKSPADCDGDPCDEGFRPVALYPAPPKLTAPEHVPPATTQDYKEAMDSLWRQNWTSAGIMFRKVLERSTMEISPDGVDFGKMTLSRRIDALADRHKITPAMKDWADLIRLEGNQAAHGDEDFSRESAKQIQEFTELFLMYTFTMPERVRLAREEAEATS